MINDMKKIISDRAYSILRRYEDVFNALPLKNFYIAGNSLNNIYKSNTTSTDIDIFIKTKEDYKTILDGLEDDSFVKVVSLTKNAITFNAMNKSFQICSYIHPTLQQLISSFDFSHIQVGVEVSIGSTFDEKFSYFDVKEVCFTEDYIVAQASGNSKYQGSEYPLSSLIRVSKYYKYGEISRGKLIDSIFNILDNIFIRGFDDYEDFKDQLDAVDLGLLPEDMNELQYSVLINLFELLRRDK